MGKSTITLRLDQNLKEIEWTFRLKTLMTISEWGIDIALRKCIGMFSTGLG